MFIAIAALGHVGERAAVDVERSPSVAEDQLERLTAGRASLMDERG
jgi:hypothetical protein